MRRKRPSRIFLRFLLSYIALILVPLLVLGSFVNTFYFNYFKSNLEQSRITSLRRTSEIVNENIDRMLAIVDGIYLSDAYEPFQLKYETQKSLPLIEYLSQIAGTHAMLSSIALHFRGDAYVYSNRSSYTTEYFFDAVLRFEDESRKSAFAALFFNVDAFCFAPVTLHGVEGVAFLYPLNLASPQFDASILFFVRNAYINNLFYDIYADDSCLLICRNDEVAARVGELSVDISALPAFGEANQVYYAPDSGGAQYLITRVETRPGYPQYYDVISVDSIFAPLVSARQDFLLLIFGLLVGLGGLMIFFSAQNYKPFKRIRNAFHEDFTQRTNDELEYILGGIRSMQTEQRALLHVAKSEKKRAAILALLKGGVSAEAEAEALLRGAGFEIQSGELELYCLVSNCSDKSASGIDLDVYLPADPEGAAPPSICAYPVELLRYRGAAVICFARDADAFNAYLRDLLGLLEAKGCIGSIGVSAPHEKYTQIPAAYREALLSVTYQFAAKRMQVFHYDARGMANAESPKYPEALIKRFCDELRLGRSGKVVESTYAIFAKIETEQMSRLTVQIILRDMFDAIIRSFIGLHIDTQIVYDTYAEAMLNLDTGFSYDIRDDVLSLCAIINDSQREEDREDHEALMSILSYIRANCVDPDFSLTLTAAHFRMTPASMAAFFKEHIGKTPMSYVNDYKLHLARQYLANSDKSVTDVCHSIGYGDVSAFIRKFKSETGFTPKEYRDSLSRGE